MENPLLVQSFIDNIGTRGAHFYSPSGCRFLTWDKVVELSSKIAIENSKEFVDKLLFSLANYNPDFEFLALGELNNSISIELYALTPTN